MKLVHHIKIAKIIADKLEENNKKEYLINRSAFYIGSIIPDINCIYPAHRLNTTKDRMLKRIESVDNASRDGIIRSFQLGIITHYVCDYFCYAHSNETIGMIHKKYEKELYNFFEIHKDLFVKGEGKEELVVKWDEALNIIREKLFSLTDTMTIESHASMVMEQIEVLNRDYMMNSQGIRRDRLWVVDKEQCERDLEYTIFMCENILKIIMNPMKCVSANYI